MQHDAMKVAEANTEQSSSRYGSNQVFFSLCVSARWFFFIFILLLRANIE